MSKIEQGPSKGQCKGQCNSDELDSNATGEVWKGPDKFIFRLRHTQNGAWHLHFQLNQVLHAPPGQGTLTSICVRCWHPYFKLEDLWVQEVYVVSQPPSNYHWELSEFYWAKGIVGII